MSAHVCRVGRASLAVKAADALQSTLSNAAVSAQGVLEHAKVNLTWTVAGCNASRQRQHMLRKSHRVSRARPAASGLGPTGLMAHLLHLSTCS